MPADQQIEFTAPAAIGDPRADLVFTPIEPCRLFDTRFDELGPIQAEWARNFYVAGISGFEEQGGNVGGCNIPYGDAAAVFINFVGVSAPMMGHLTAFAYEEPDPPLPRASVLNYDSSMFAIGNGVAVPICDTLLQNCSFDLIVWTNRTIHVVGDAYGYWAPPTP
jgi:hypothetical protein